MNTQTKHNSENEKKQNTVKQNYPDSVTLYDT